LHAVILAWRGFREGDAAKVTIKAGKEPFALSAAKGLTFRLNLQTLRYAQGKRR
jgi:hypothetical protein